MGSQPQPSLLGLGTKMAPEEFDPLAVDKFDFPLLCALKQGDIAPPLSLPTRDGQLVHSRDLLRAGPVVLTFYRGVWCPYCQRDLKALAETANAIKAFGASLIAIAHQTVPDSNRKFEQESNLGFSILDDTSGIAAAAFGIGWTSECLRELFEQFSTDRTGFNPEVPAIAPMQARYVIGPDDIIAYADINVDYRSDPELSAVLPVLQLLQNATS